MSSFRFTYSMPMAQNLSCCRLTVLRFAIASLVSSGQAITRPLYESVSSAHFFRSPMV